MTGVDLGRAAAQVAVASALAAAAVWLLARAAPRVGLLDHPGGRKAHAHAVPLVGGLAIFAALTLTAFAFDVAPSLRWFLAALGLVAAVGFWDDVADIRPRIKFAVQIAAAAAMIWGAGVELRSVGDLLGWRPIGLWLLTIPLTVFAVVGVVNAINMVDGLDGLAGSIALVAFAWYAAVAQASGLGPQREAALIFCGAIAGFLAFNLRLPGRPRARAFLGDAGSLMLGFALGWLAVDLTQGPGRTFPPINALWVLMVPLADCVSIMTRRLRAGSSPFAADSRHIHHYLLARGFSHGHTLAILVGLSALFGAAGYAAWRLELPEAALFWPFFFGYFAYHAWITRAWKRLAPG